MESWRWCTLKKTFLVTGAAGFIGAALIKSLLNNGERVIGIDNLNDYYNPLLKKARLEQIQCISNDKNWHFHEISIENEKNLFEIFTDHKPQIVVNLAAQAGVRYSIENPNAYIQSNIVGFLKILEACREFNIEHLVYASSSSVYGGNKNLPFSEKQPVNHPVSIYAASKKANELMAHTYSHLYQIPCTGLRFFTVYGPWGRPDMAPMIFANSILNSKPIKVFNYGNMQRDFTFIDDIVEGIIRCCYKKATSNINFDSLNPDPSTAASPHRIFNIGNSNPINLLRFIEILENSLGVKAIKDFQPIQPGDVIATSAQTTSLEEWIGFKPYTKIEKGIEIFSKWYKDFYGYK